MAETDLTVQAGEPYNRQIRVVDGKTIWSSLADFEVRSQVRGRQSVTSRLLADLGESMTAAFDGNDIVISLALTGQDTYALSSGFYDVFLSDVGVVDARAIRVLHGKLDVTPATTDGV